MDDKSLYKDDIQSDDSVRDENTDGVFDADSFPDENDDCDTVIVEDPLIADMFTEDEPESPSQVPEENADSQRDSSSRADVERILSSGGADSFRPDFHNGNVPKYTVHEHGANVKKGDTSGTPRAVQIIALCLCCAIVGGVFGGITSGVVSKKTYESLISSQRSVSAQSDASVGSGQLDGNVGSPLVEISDIPETSSPESEVASDAPEDTAAQTTHIQVTNVVSAGLTAKEIYAKYVDCVVGIATTVKYSSGVFGQTYTATATGSGFIVSEDGYIVTNYHVVENGTDFSVSLYNGDKYSAELVGYEDSNDIAVLKIAADNLNVVNFGISDELAVGDTLLIIGNPLGELTYTLTNGVVSALNRSITSGSTAINMFQTNAVVNSGNSGGPVFDMNGKVVGIATAKYTSESVEGLTFCIPVDDVAGYIVDIMTYGYVKNKALLGVSVQTVNTMMAARYNTVVGAYVVAVGASSAAEKAGIKQNDVITAVGSEKIETVIDLQNHLKKFKSGETATLTVYSSGSYRQVQVTFDEKGPAAAARTSYSNVYDM